MLMNFGVNDSREMYSKEAMKVKRWLGQKLKTLTDKAETVQIKCWLL